MPVFRIAKESVQREWAVMARPSMEQTEMCFSCVCCMFVWRGEGGLRRLLVHIQRVLVNLCDVCHGYTSCISMETSGKDAGRTHHRVDASPPEAASREIRSKA